MGLGFPAGLWWLALLPPIVLLYLLKQQRSPRRVSSTQLWEEVRTEIQASTPFRRLRAQLQLLLQLLAAALLAVAVADPRVWGQSESGRAVVVVMDASASMGSTDLSPSRLEEARRRLRELIDAMEPDDELMILVAAGGTVVDQIGFTGRAAPLEQFAGALAQTDARAGVREALLVAYAAVGRRVEETRRTGEVIVLSDGARLGAAELPPPPVPLRYIPCGSRTDNVGITAFSLRRIPASSRRYAVFCELNAWGPAREVALTIGLGADGPALAQTRIAVLPGRPERRTFELELAPGVVHARIDPGGDLAADDRALEIVPAPTPVVAAFAGPANPFLVRALETDPLVTVVAYEPGRACDLLFATGTVPSELPEVPVILFAPEGELPGLVRGEPIQRARLDAWNTSHPLLDALFEGDIALLESQTFASPPAVPLARAGSQVVGAQLATREVPLIAFGFRLEHTNWPLRPSFPLFVLELVEMARERGARDRALVLAPGQIAPLEADPAVPLQVLRPDGRTDVLPAGDSVRYYGRTDRVGRYVVDGARESRELVVNLLDAQESDTAPREILELGTPAEGGPSLPPEAARPDRAVWRLLALAALLASLAEWWAYHRKI